MHKITVVGLGSGEKSHLPVNVYEKLNQGDPVIVKTSDDPVLNELSADGIVFDALGEVKEDLADENEIITRLINKAEQNPVIFAVPGDLLESDRTVKELKIRYENVEVLESRGFLDRLVHAVSVDPLKEGVQLIDSAELNADSVQTGQSVFVLQVGPAHRMATEVKATLMSKYPDDHCVALIEYPGSRSETVKWLRLYEIDRLEATSNLRTLYCPPLILDEQVTSLSTLQHYIDQVTSPDGDVWINEQTPYSLIRYLKEETGELIEAIEKEDTDNWMEELGDVLVQILYQTNAAEKEGLFTFEDVLENVNRKIRRRHPHVFDGVEATTPEEVDAIWQKIKREEKRMKDET
ncbi:MAG: nucleotide pyrophosphohydrolase [Alkalibacterium sp.]|nr:nucleotide pyrophosphohydrolase [Alkalibacterium sp.]